MVYDSPDQPTSTPDPIDPGPMPTTAPLPERRTPRWAVASLVVGGLAVLLALVFFGVAAAAGRPQAIAYATPLHDSGVDACKAIASGKGKLSASDMVAVGQLSAAWTDLAGACADHDIEIPSFSDISK